MPTEQPVLSLPEGKSRLLLHSCCAPCAGDIMETLAKSDIQFTIYFYNPNIHPRQEYDIRKDENKRFAKKLGIPFIDDDYNKDDWFARTQGMENEPERGIRCTACFDMRFERTAAYAEKHGFDCISSTLGISRWKDMDQINGCGTQAVKGHPDLLYWTYNWRKHGGAGRMYKIAKQESFYAQQYCGCVYSLRDTNRWRVKNNRDKINIGNTYYDES